MDPMNLNLIPAMTDTGMEDASVLAPRIMDPRASGALPLTSRAIDPGFMPHTVYAPNFAHPSMGSMPYTGGGPTGAFANANEHSPLVNHQYTKIETINDLLSPASPDFEFRPELNAVLHVGKCQECVHFGFHILMPGNRAKFLCATVAYSEAITKPLRDEVDKLNREAIIASRSLRELQDALQSNQKLAASMKAERDEAWKERDEALSDCRTLSKRVKDMEQWPTAPYRRPSSPVRHNSPSRPGPRSHTPYDRVHPHRMGPVTSRRHQVPTPVILDPSNDGDVVMTSLPTNIRSMRMHRDQPRYNNRRPCPVVNYRWKTDSDIEVIGLPKTRAGTPYIPNDLGLGWCGLENNAASIDEVLRRIDLLFRNRKEELWRAAARSAFEFRRLAEPLPEVMVHFLQLYGLRKSVWTIINDGVASGADLSIISPGCRLHNEGYAGLYTPDIHLWAVIHTVTDVDADKLTARTGRTVTIADLKKMVKDALCSGNYFNITPTELANGKYKLPLLAHYDGALDMNAIVEWLRTTIGMTPYMVHAHFRPFLRRAFDVSKGACHKAFSPTSLLPDESLAPKPDDVLADFPVDREWNPDRGPRGRILPVPEPTANAPPGPLDMEMVDPVVITANAPLVTPPSTIN